MKDKQYLLMILDGVGLNDEEKGNAFRQANKPNLDRLFNKYPNGYLKSSGIAVGLPEGQMGNSEVGHTNIGAGRVIYQELTRISKEIKEGDFFKNEALNAAITNVKNNNSALHLMGLVSDGGVHSHIEHLYALLELAKKNEVKNVYVHAFTDGRDTSYTSAIEFLKQLEEKMKQLGVGQIATINGRYYAMDRDKRWDRVELAYNALTLSEGNKFRTVQKAIENSYEAQEFDEFIKPIIIVDESSKPIASIKDNDSVIFFNYRPDRARQICHVFLDENFDGFTRKSGLIKNLKFVTMTQYDEKLNNVLVAYTPQVINNTLGEYISNLGYTQLRIAETEKYAHVTFFFNGGEEEQYTGEDRILVPSPKVATYDLKPEMSAAEVTEKVIEAVESKKYDLIIMNYANGDMVGHTGNMEKAVEAVEALDKCVGKVISLLEKVSGEAIITADHGNCEYMIDPKTGEVITSHSTFEVPIIVVSDRVKSIASGSLCDIAPTMLALMGEKIPNEMTGISLIEI
ncbi:MAG: 2,3-bisphosphoglycerate-independent phosphoglycerate mutase [Clostridia bacterium]|nr:2,3-bisphosphoglycerate-independent phosphoglycerate mutase [Clostridia bacterium]